MKVSLCFSEGSLGGEAWLIGNEPRKGLMMWRVALVVLGSILWPLDGKGESSIQSLKKQILSEISVDVEPVSSMALKVMFKAQFYKVSIHTGGAFPSYDTYMEAGGKFSKLKIYSEPQTLVPHLNKDFFVKTREDAKVVGAGLLELLGSRHKVKDVEKVVKSHWVEWQIYMTGGRHNFTVRTSEAGVIGEISQRDKR